VRGERGGGRERKSRWWLVVVWRFVWGRVVEWTRVRVLCSRRAGLKRQTGWLNAWSVRVSTGSITNEQKDHEVGFVHGCKCEWSMQVTLVRLVGKMAKGRWILGEDEAEIWNLGSSNRVEYPWDTELAQ
jgi:hypothetical protein